MATLEQGIVSYLQAQATLTTLIGTRIYPFRFPQDVTMPCMTYQRISTPRLLTHDDVGATGTLANPRIQFDAWAGTYDLAKQITDVLRALLNGKTGSIGSGGNAVVIRNALVDNEVPEYVVEYELHRITSDYLIWLEE